MSLYRDTYALVDLKRLEHNIQVSYQHQKKPMMAIIKANDDRFIDGDDA